MCDSGNQIANANAVMKIGQEPVVVADEWDAEKEFKLMNSSLSATPRKIVVHILLHEIRHWAQIATILRFNGLTGNFHDFLFSPAMGGSFRPES